MSFLQILLYSVFSKCNDVEFNKNGNTDNENYYDNINDINSNNDDDDDDENDDKDHDMIIMKTIMMTTKS